MDLSILSPEPNSTHCKKKSQNPTQLANLSKSGWFLQVDRLA